MLLCAAFLGLVVPWLAARPAAAQTPSPQTRGYYLYDRATFQFVLGDAFHAPHRTWEVWLYNENANVPQAPSASRYAASSLAYTRWGAIEGPSARAVIEQLVAVQSFERAYNEAFGPTSWGRFTFSHAVEPIAIAKEPAAEPAELLEQMILMNDRLSALASTLRLSLANSEPGELTPLLRGYFDQVRNCLEDAARLAGELGRMPSERSYLKQEIERLTADVTEAESALPLVKAALPTVKLPVAQSWMTHAEQGGSEGTVEVNVVEVGSAAWVNRNWSCGDGSMAGTVVVTIVPYQDIGTLDVWSAPLSHNHGWTVRISSASSGGFPESLSSPERRTAKRTYPAVDLKSTARNIYLEFANPADAQDAYAFFLYHKERGR